MVQSVLLFGVETWVLLTESSKKQEGVHVGVPHKCDGKDGQVEEGRDPENRSSGECTQRSGDTDTGERTLISGM